MHCSNVLRSLGLFKICLNSPVFPRRKKQLFISNSISKHSWTTDMNMKFFTRSGSDVNTRFLFFLWTQKPEATCLLRTRKNCIAFFTSLRDTFVKKFSMSYWKRTNRASLPYILDRFADFL